MNHLFVFAPHSEIDVPEYTLICSETEHMSVSLNG